MEGHSGEALEEIRGSLVAIMGEQNSRLMEVTKRHDMVMSGISNELCDMKRIVWELHGGGPSRNRTGEGGSQSTRLLKLDLA